MNKNTFILCFGLFVQISCSNEKPEAPKKDEPKPAANLKSEVKLLDPLKAKVMVASQPTLGSANQVSSLKVPVFSISIESSDIVQVLRCASDYTLQAKNGQPFNAMTTGTYSDYDMEQAKWIWQEAFGSYQKCNLVGSNISKAQVQDLAANSGEYFYLINPCVSKALSSSGNEACSYRLAKTSNIKYANNMEAEFIENSKQLAEIEGLLSSQFSQLYVYVQDVKTYTEACETRIISAQVRANILKGAAGIAAITVGAAVGGIIGGPVGAVKGGETALGLANGLLNAIKSGPAMKCQEVETITDNMGTLTKEIERQVTKVVDIRKKLNAIDASYGDLDKTISTQTGE